MKNKARKFVLAYLGHPRVESPLTFEEIKHKQICEDIETLGQITGEDFHGCRSEVYSLLSSLWNAALASRPVGLVISEEDRKVLEEWLREQRQHSMPQYELDRCDALRRILASVSKAEKEGKQ